MMFGYWLKNWSFNYKLGYGIVRAGLRTFYKKYEVKGLENLPTDGGILFAVNHQNAFMDPIMVACQLEKNTYYLTRADIFKKKFVAKILGSIYMLPIYRQRDGVNTITSNEKTFDQCFDILKEKGCIVIFPEGNHNSQKKLRPLKKGIARIGLGSANKYSYNNKVYIVPVGLNYSNHTNMGATLLINFGDPIALEKYYDQHKNDPSNTINNLVDKVENEMGNLILNIHSSNYEHINELINITRKRFHFLSKENYSLSNEFEIQKNLIQKIESLEQKDPNHFKKLIENTQYVSSFLKENNLRSYLFDDSLKTNNSVILNIFFLFLLLPIHLTGLLSNYLPYKIPVWLVNKKVKDLHFHSSIKMTLGVILFFLFWSTQFMLIAGFFGLKIGALYLASLPILAWFNYQYWIYFLKTKGSLKYRKLKNESKTSKAEKSYNEIIATLDKL